MKQKVISLSAEWRLEKQVDGKGKGKDQNEEQPRESGTRSTDPDSDIEVVEMSHKATRDTKVPRANKATRLR
jgi:hypothetical protein